MTSLTRSWFYSVAVLLAVAPGVVLGEIQTPSTATVQESGDDGFECTLDIKLYDPVEVTFLTFGLEAQYTCTSPIPNLSMTQMYSPDDGWDVENFPDGFQGPATIANCVADFAHFDCPPLLEELQTPTYAAEGPEGPLPELPAICVSRVECSTWSCSATGPFVADACGDPDRSGTIQTTDALITLRAAVSLATCTPAQCDADRSGSLSAGDALRVLRAAVGIPGGLLCPAPC